MTNFNAAWPTSIGEFGDDGRVADVQHGRSQAGVCRHDLLQRGPPAPGHDDGEAQRQKRGDPRAASARPMPEPPPVRRIVLPLVRMVVVLGNGYRRACMMARVHSR